MFESLVSSRIRRALFEHIVTHPANRFYLRGLAKELNLSISPLRRELLRLEQAGILKTYQEGNLRFYTVEQAHPAFLQLKQAASPGQAVAVPAALLNPSAPAPVEPVAEAPVAVAVEEAPEQVASEPVVQESVEPLISSTVLSSKKIDRIRRALTPWAQWPVILGATSLVVLACAIAGIAGYLMIQNQQWLELTTTSVVTTKPEVATPAELGKSDFGSDLKSDFEVELAEPAVLPQAMASADPTSVVDTQPILPARAAAAGEMRSNRWRLMPGRIGGLSSGEVTH